MEKDSNAFNMTRRKYLFSLLGIFAFGNLNAAEKSVGYMSLKKLAELCSMKIESSNKGKTQILSSKFIKMIFDLHQRSMLINDNKLWLGFPIATNAGGGLALSQSDYAKAITPILFPQKNGKVPYLNHIVLDAGHGGKDNGAQNKSAGLVEKSLALDMVNRLTLLLRKSGFKVTLTRTKDVFIPLEGRSKIANDAKANLFLSLHFNSTSSSSVEGVETFALTPVGQPSTNNDKVTSSCHVTHKGNANDAWNTLLAYYVNSMMKKSTSAQDRGAKRARFTVLTNLNMPGALVECGFLSSTQEAKKIKDAKYRDKIAEGILNGILRYQATLTRLRKTVAENAPTTDLQEASYSWKV